jgi:hypothetical protein
MLVAPARLENVLKASSSAPVLPIGLKAAVYESTLEISLKLFEISGYIY